MAMFSGQISLELTEQKALKNLKAMVKRGKSSRSFLQLHAYPVYIKAQMKRWMSENESQGEKWAPLNPAYAKYKLNKFSSAPGSGKKMMIATGTLYKSIIGAGPGHFKLIDDKKMIVGTDVPYATYPASRRPIQKWNKDFIRILKQKWISYLIKGKAV